MTTFSDTWNAGYEAIPPDSENASQGASRIRGGRRDTRERMEVDHSFAGDGHDGKHTKLTLRDQGSDPSLEAGESSLYGLVTAGFTRLFHRTSARIKDLAPPGEIRMGVWTTPPAGWLLCTGGTIGNSSSGATARANADTEALFILLWDNWSNTAAPVSGGRGGSGANDYAANKTIGLPDFRGRSPMGTGQGSTAEGGGTGTSRTIGDKAGAETHSLTAAQGPSHSHSISNISLSISSGPGTAFFAPSGSAPTTTGVGNSGSGTAHNNVGPVIVISFIISL